jgi:hypothetical protein
MHQVRHICKAHKSRHTKENLAKEPALFHASWTHPTSVDTYVTVRHPKEGRTYNMRFCVMAADPTQHQILIRYRTAYPA